MTADESAQPATPLNRTHARPARALIGWLPADDAHSLIAGPGVEAPYAEDVLRRAEHARDTVAARAPVGAKVEVITDSPPELSAYITELEAKPFYKLFLAEGGRFDLPTYDTSAPSNLLSTSTMLTSVRAMLMLAIFPPWRQ